MPNTPFLKNNYLKKRAKKKKPLSLKTYRSSVKSVGGLDGLWTLKVRIEIQVPGRKIHKAVDLLSPLSLVHKPAIHAHVHIYITKYCCWY